jgi:hypothetical protein
MTLLDVDFDGDCAHGQREPLSGIIRNLNVLPAGFDSAEARFLFEAAVLTEYELGVYVDGGLIQRINSGSTQASLAGLLDGRHSISLASNRIGDIWPERHGDPQGSRAYLRWPRSSDTKVEQYQLFWDRGLGGSPNTLLAVLKDVTIDQRIYMKASTGQPGRITTFGHYTGSRPVNDAIILDVKSDSTFAYSTALGLSGSGEWVQGLTIPLPYGTSATIHDDPADYNAESLYGIAIGPTNEYLTDDLEPGTYKFAVKAISKAGNVSSTVLQKTVRIIFVPDPVSDVVVSYAAGAIGVTWSDPTVLDGVRVYTNWDPIMGRFQSYIITDAPLATITPGTEAWTFDPGSVEGVLKYYLRPYKGVEECKDSTLRSFSFPPTPLNLGIVLGAPSNLKATAIAAGGIRVEWDYRFRGGDGLDEFHVSIQGASGTPNFASNQVDAVDGEGFPVAHYSVDYAGPFMGTKYVQVRAESPADTATTVSVEVSVVPDASLPTFAGDLRGVSQ